MTYIPDKKTQYCALKTLRRKLGGAIGRNCHASFSPQEAVKILSYLDEKFPKPKGYQRPAYEDKVASRLRT
jgi:hypothetical protein